MKEIPVYSRAGENGRKEKECFCPFHCSLAICECMWEKTLLENFGHVQKIKKKFYFLLLLTYFRKLNNMN